VPSRHFDLEVSMQTHQELKHYREMAQRYEKMAVEGALLRILTSAQDLEEACSLARVALGWAQPIVNPDDYRLPDHAPELPAWVAEELRGREHEPLDDGEANGCPRGCADDKQISLSGPPPLSGTEESWEYGGYEPDPPPGVDGG
jgi:hypothetical protein